jgi:predicted SprT family Zn-dependent metalloprotease
MSVAKILLAGEKGMELIEAEELALVLMRKHGLKGWTYATNKRKKTLGLCFSKIRRIELSVNFIHLNSPEIVQETVLHEIAHALVGTHHGHDDDWKRMAERVGASPLRTTKNVVMPHGKWQATCGGCGLLFSRHRRPKYMDGNSCRRCGPALGLLSYRHIKELLAEAQEELVAHAVQLKQEPSELAAHMAED